MDARTEANIRIGDIKDFGPVWVCGCEWRPIDAEGVRRWFLCSYHMGFDDALEMVDL